MKRHKDKMTMQTTGRLTELRQKVGEFEILEGGLEWAEETLRDATQRWMSLTENTNDFILIVDNKARIQYINRAIPPHTIDHVIGKTLYDFAAPEHHEIIRQAVVKTFEKGEQVSYESSVEHPIGILWFDATMIPITEEEEVTGAMLFNKDITERKRAEAALRESERRYKAIFDNQLSMVYVHNEQLVFLEANDTALERLGYTRHDLGKVSFQDMLHPEDFPKVLEGFADIWAKGFMEHPVEIRLIVKSGGIIWVETYGIPLERGADHYIGLGIAKDITERKQVEDLIRSQRDLAVELGATGDLTDGLNLCLDAALHVSAMDCGGVYLLDETTGAMDLIVHKGLSADFVRTATHYDADAPNVRLVMAGTPAYARHQELPVPLDDAERSEKLRAIAIVPLPHLNRVVGCLNVSSHTLDEVPLLARDALETIAAQIGGAIARLRAEEALRRQEEKYRAIVDKSPLGMSLIDKNGSYQYVNPKFVELFGYTIEDIPTGREWFAKAYPDQEYREQVISTWIADLKSSHIGELRPRTFNATCRDGSEKVIQFRPVSLAGGDQLVSYEDITERKQAEEALRESEARYRGLVEGALDVIFTISVDGRLTSLNPAFEIITGWPCAEWIGKHFASVVHPDDLPIAEEAFQSGLQAELRQAYEVRIPAKSGEYLLAEIKGGPQTESGAVVGVWGMARDITERKKAEEILREAEARYSALMNLGGKLGEAIVMLQDTERGEAIHIVVSDEWPRITGYSRKELLRMSFFDLLHPRYQKASFKRHRRKMGGEIIPGLFEMSIIRKDGVEVPIELTSAYTTYQGQRANVAFIRDITERKQIEEERQRAAKLESIGTLAGGIAHDFNNLLTGIMGNIGLAKRHIEPGGRASARLDEAEKASMRARDLTQQLLTFARGGTPVKQVTSIRGLTEDSAKFALRGSNVRSAFSLADDLWPVEIDEGQMGQVVQNLVINADEAMPGGGVINIRAKNTIVEKKSALPLNKGKYVEITVEDHGVGIPKKHLTRIFEPYFSTKQKGSGLGLATAYSIIKNHDGHVTVESQLGIGTTFHIYLPASSRRAPQRREEAVQPSLLEAGRILAMDDEELIRDLLYSELSGIGYEVELASDGAEAIERYAEAKKSGKPFDAVIMDLTVPGGMGGKEAIKKLLEIDREAKVIVSSGYSTDPIMADYRKYGFSAVATKPYTVAELEKTLHSILKGRRSK